MSHIILATMMHRWLKCKQLKLYVWRMLDYTKLSQTSHPFMSYEKNWEEANMVSIDYFFRMNVHK